MIGFALDERAAGSYVMSVSVDGSLVSPNGLPFSGIDAPFLSPALSGDGRDRASFGDDLIVLLHTHLPVQSSCPCTKLGRQRGLICFNKRISCRLELLAAAAQMLRLRLDGRAGFSLER